MNFSSEILLATSRFGLDPDLVAAQVQVESNEDPWAWNPEPGYRYLWDVKRWRPFRTLTLQELGDEKPPSDFSSLAGDPDQEWWGQQASWGLMQVMGGVAREKGFRGPYLTMLCDPKTNIALGCQILAELLNWSHGNLDQALSAYNGGKGGNEKEPFRNIDYARKVQRARAVLIGKV